MDMETQVLQALASSDYRLSDNDLVKKAYTLNTTAAWAKSQLKILSDMADDHKLPDWVSRHARKIMDGIMLLS